MALSSSSTSARDEQVAGAYAVDEAIGDALAAARLRPSVAERIVDSLEAVDVQEQQPEHPTGRCRLRACVTTPAARDVRSTQHPVAEARQAVVVGEVADLLVRPATLGDVLDRAFHEARALALAPDGMRLSVHQTLAAVGQHGAEVGHQRGPVLDADAHGILHVEPVVAVDARKDHVAGNRVIALDLVERPELGRPLELHRLQIELEASDPGQSLGVGQVLLAALELADVGRELLA